MAVAVSRRLVGITRECRTRATGDISRFFRRTKCLVLTECDITSNNNLSFRGKGRTVRLSTVAIRGQILCNRTRATTRSGRPVSGGGVMGTFSRCLCGCLRNITSRCR